MTFITYVFLGLCLPMVALCAGQECACIFPGKQYLSITTPGNRIENPMYINTDEKWAFRKDGPWRYIAYDLKTMTLYEVDATDNTCKTSSVSESDDIFKYQCIDKMAMKIDVGPNSSGTYTYVASNRDDFTRQIYTVGQQRGEDTCQPSYAEFELSQGGKVIVDYRGDLRGDRYKQVYDNIIKFCMEH